MATVTKKQLNALVQEQVQKTLKEYDRGDIELAQSHEADSLVKQSDMYLDTLKGIVKNLYRRGDPNSLTIIKQLNTSLGPFVSKVSQAAKTKV